MCHHTPTPTGCVRARKDSITPIMSSTKPAAQNPHPHPPRPTQPVITHEEMAEGSSIPLEIWKKTTSPDFLGHDVDITKPLDHIHATTYVGERLDEGSRVTSLLGYVRDYQDDFEGWGKVQFRQVHRLFQRVLVRQLQDLGYPFLPQLSTLDQLLHPFGDEVYDLIQRSRRTS